VHGRIENEITDVHLLKKSNHPAQSNVSPRVQRERLPPKLLDPVNVHCHPVQHGVNAGQMRRIAWVCHVTCPVKTDYRQKDAVDAAHIQLELGYRKN